MERQTQYPQSLNISFYGSMEFAITQTKLERKTKEGIRKVQQLVRDLDGGYFIFE